MADTFIEVPTDVDELNLSLRGWTVYDFRARLLLPNHSPRSGEFAKLTVAIRSRFNAEDSVESFRDLEAGAYTPPLVVVLSEPSLTEIPTMVERFERVKKASQGVTDTIRPEYIGTPPRWRPPGAMSLTLTAYDDADLSMSDLDLMTPVKCPIDIVDGTSEGRAYGFSDISAWLLRPIDPDSESLKLRLSGFATIDPKAGRPARRKYDWTEITPPQIAIEVIDSTGFPMHTSEVCPMQAVRTDRIPARAGRWVTETGLDLHTNPSRIIVRLTDSEGDDPETDDEW